jgi:hypothetical protein
MQTSTENWARSARAPETVDGGESALHRRAYATYKSQLVDAGHQGARVVGARAAARGALLDAARLDSRVDAAPQLHHLLLGLELELYAPHERDAKYWYLAYLQDKLRENRKHVKNFAKAES